MGCKIKVNRHGYLAFRIFGAGIPGGRSWEGTGLKDTPENRAYVEAKATIISMQMKNNSFDYLTCFPHGNKAGYFEQQRKPKIAQTVAQYIAQLRIRKVPPLVRESFARDLKQHTEAYIIPYMGTRYLEHVTGLVVEEMRQWLLQELNLTVKTARNVIGGTLRAIFRDAKDVDKLINHNPCDGIQWPREETKRKDPFTESERDNILEYFYTKKRWSFPFVYFQFWTGCRPSESTALRWNDVDLTLGIVDISKSRHLKHDAATKTKASERVIHLLPEVLSVLKDLKPVVADENAHVFLNAIGRPLDANDWAKKHWRPALAAAKVRPRIFYNTRHTFISLGLSYGINLQWICEVTGTSPAMLQKSYGKWMPVGKVQPQVQPSLSGNQKRKNVKGLTWWSQRESNPCYRRERPVCYYYGPLHSPNMSTYQQVIKLGS